MKFSKIFAVSLALITLVMFSACSAGQNPDTQLQKTVAKGDLAVKVNGSGKIVYSTDAKLAFDTVGKIEKLSVKEGDKVTKGAVLAQLETDNLELALSQAKVAAIQAQKATSQAEIGVTQSEIALTQVQSGLTQAQSGLTLAQFNLDRIEAVGDIKDKIMKLEMLIAAAEVNRKQASASGDTADFQYLNTYIIELNAEIDKRNNDLQVLLGKDEYVNVAPYEIMIYDPFAQEYTLGGQRYDRLTVEDIRLKQQQVTIAEKGVESAQQNIDLANQNIELAKQTVEQTKLTVEQAQKAVGVAQKQLDNATITAPFDGIAANVSIKQGDYILTPGLSSGIPIYLVDPNSLEISTEIDELDIANVQVNQLAVIKLDALPDVKLTGTVASIAVTPKVKALNSGLVVYEVKVKFDSMPSAQVKSGMNVSVDIVTTEKKGVILLPNKAIKNGGEGQKVVDVLTGQKIAEQAVVLGLTDGSFTEVVSGVNEGDVVLLQP